MIIGSWPLYSFHVLSHLHRRVRIASAKLDLMREYREEHPNDALVLIQVLKARDEHLTAREHVVREWDLVERARLLLGATA